MINENDIVETIYFWKIRNSDGNKREIETKMTYSTYVLEDYIAIFEERGFKVYEILNIKVNKHNKDSLHYFCEMGL